MGKMLISWYSSFAGTENHGFQAYVEATESEPDDITVFLCKYSDSGNGNQKRICLNVLFVLRICPTALNGKNCDYGHPSSNKKQEITVEIIWLKTGMKVNRMKYTSTLLAVSDMEKSK